MRNKFYTRSLIHAALCLLIFACLAFPARALEFQVGVGTNLTVEHFTGRVLLYISRAKPPEKNGIAAVDKNALCVLGADADDFGNGKTVVVTLDAPTYFFSPNANFPAGHYFVWANLERSVPLDPTEPSTAFAGRPQEADLNPARDEVVHLSIDFRTPPQLPPQDTQFTKFLHVKSELLSKFHGRPMYLHAGIILPSDYYEHPDRRYPVWVRIGGLGARYWSVNSLMGEKSDFRKMWNEPDTPRMILLQLDGAGPYGDCYQVNSANNGPYGDALIQELLPAVEREFRCLPHARVLSGLSTGGWAALALQIFYPDEFDGVWSSCPDPVDFRSFELVNIYEETNAYVNAYGYDRPSERTIGGDTKLTLRREVQMENVLGRGDSWTMSGQQWGAWNAVFSPRGENGFPERLWDPKTGVINRSVAEAWKKYDLHLYLQEHWKMLAPKLQGKLHIAAGDADVYFLNNAVHRLDDFLSHANPPYKGTIVYGSQKGHGWTNLSLKQMLAEMQAAVERKSNAKGQP